MRLRTSCGSATASTPPTSTRAAARPQIAGEDAQRGRLAGAVEAEEADGLARVDFERHRAERPLAAIELRDICSANHSEDLASRPTQERRIAGLC